VGKKRYTAEQIIAALRKAEIATAKGQSVAETCRQLEISEQTYYRWRRECGELRVDQAARLRALEKENQRLKRIVADQAVDLAILKEGVEGNY